MPFLPPNQQCQSTEGMIDPLSVQAFQKYFRNDLLWGACFHVCLSVCLSVGDRTSLELQSSLRQLCARYLSPWLGPTLAPLRYVNLIPVSWITSSLRIVTKKRRSKESLYSKWLDTRFYSATNTQNDPPQGSTRRQWSLMLSSIASWLWCQLPGPAGQSPTEVKVSDPSLHHTGEALLVF